VTSYKARTYEWLLYTSQLYGLQLNGSFNFKIERDIHRENAGE